MSFEYNNTKVSALIKDLNQRTTSGRHVVPIKYICDYLEDTLEEKRRVAGALDSAFLANYGNCVCAIGKCVKDLREVDANGDIRDFSEHKIRTSMVERLEYLEMADTTVIYTRNSVYNCRGNLISECLDLEDTVVAGVLNIQKHLDTAEKNLMSKEAASVLLEVFEEIK